MAFDPPDPANLLIKATLEAVLAQDASRHDATARLERVKAAALMECAEKGYSALTLVGVARRAKVSTASIYAAYKDRDAVLVAAMEMLFAILATDQIAIPPADHPRDQVEQLLIAHGLVYEQAITLWVFRLHMTLVWAGHGHLAEIGQRTFEGIDAFWRGYLGTLNKQGHLAATDVDTIVPVLLSSIERVTIMARLGCGNDEPDRPAYTTMARYAADTLFGLWGSNSKSSRGTGVPDFTGCTAQAESLAQGPVGAVGAVVAGPSARDRLSAELGQLHARRTIKGRSARILLAAVVVCQDQGYNAASVQDVARLARVSTATVYKQFKDKADLFASALEAELFWRGSLKNYLARAEVTFDSVAGLVYAIAMRATDPEWMWVYNLIWSSEISGTARIVEAARRIRAEEEAILAQGLAAEQVASSVPDAAVTLQINLLLGIMERRGVLSWLLFGQQTVTSANLAMWAVVASRFAAVLPGRDAVLSLTAA
jgi:AcrR family transcriptional regulator